MSTAVLTHRIKKWWTVIKEYAKVGNVTQYILNTKNPIVKALIEFDMKLSEEFSMKALEKEKVSA